MRYGFWLHDCGALSVVPSDLNLPPQPQEVYFTDYTLTVQRDVLPLLGLDTVRRLSGRVLSKSFGPRVLSRFISPITL